VTATDGSGLFSEPFPPDPERFYQVAFAGLGDDNIAPTWPAGAALTADTIESNAVDLIWPAAIDPNLVAYALYQNGEHVGTFGSADLSAYISDLDPNTLYEFQLFACDANQNCTEIPGGLKVRTRTKQEPYRNPPRSGSTFIGSGEFSISRTDMKIEGRELGFTFTRFYRSNFERSGPLGYGWMAKEFERLRKRANGDVVWQQGSGRSDRFVSQPGGDYAAPAGVFMTLSKRPAGFRLITSNGTTRLFDLDGRIISITTRNGNTLTYVHSGSRLTSITDDMGRDTSFTYDAEGRIETITDFTGREVRYAYDAAGNLIAARSPLVSGTPNGNDFPAGKTERYQYDVGNADPDLAHNLIQIVAANEVADGSQTPSQTMTYGSGGALHDRILTHTIGGTNASGVPAGGTITYSYTSNSGTGGTGLIARNTITDRRGNQVHHDFNTNGHLTRKTEVLAGRADAVTSYTYDADGNFLTVTYPEGNVVTNTYDATHRSRRSQGNLLSVTQTPGPRGATQAQLTTAYTYEPVFNQVRTTTDPRGFIWATAFDYEEDCDFAAIGLHVGLSAADTESLLTAVGMCNGASPGDINNDGDTSQVTGNVIRHMHPTVALDPASNQAALEGDASQEVVEFYQYNQFGQPTAHLDAEKNRHQWSYYAEADPDNDGNVDNPSGNATTGGYLATATLDSAGGAQRNSGTNPPPTAITTAYAYNPCGVATSIIDPRGVETRYAINELDQPVQILRAASVGNGTPDPEPVLLTAFAFVSDHFYDANNNVVRRDVEDRGDTSNTGGIVTTGYAYDILNQRLATIDEIGAGTIRTVGARYDANGNLALAIRGEGNAAAYQYEERDLVIATTTGATSAPPGALLAGAPTFNPRGGAPSNVTFEWDGNRNRISVTDAADTDASAANNGPAGGDMTMFVYDGFDRLIQTIDPAGNVSAVEYDANGNTVRSRRFGPDGGPTPTTNAPSTNLLTDTSSRYDELNRLTQTDRLLFSNTVPAADIQEDATSIGKGDLIPGDGATNQRYEYDALGRQTFTVEDDGDISSTLYDGVGRVLVATDPLGNRVEYAYDDQGNVIETRETDTATLDGVADESFLTTSIYDSLNRLTVRVDNLGHATRYEYDSRDNVLVVSDPNGPPPGISITRRAFPDAPTTVNAVNGHGNLTRHTYDGLNRRLRTQRVLTGNGFGNGTLTPTPDPAQGGGDGLITSRTVYDLNDLVTARLDDQRFATSTTYDNLNRPTVEMRGQCPPTAPPGYICDPVTTIQFSYDPDNNLIQSERCCQLRKKSAAGVTVAELDLFSNRPVP
jgi:YD repeat-containing protein